MTLITLRHDHNAEMDCQVLINPETERLYAICHIASEGQFIPVKTARQGSQLTGKIDPIPYPGQPGQVWACASQAEALAALEQFDASLNVF